MTFFCETQEYILNSYNLLEKKKELFLRIIFFYIPQKNVSHLGLKPHECE